MAEALGLGAVGTALLNVGITAAVTVVGALTGSQSRRSPQRLDDLTIGAATYGKHVPLPFGQTRVPTNVIWGRQIEERAISIGKGGVFTSDSTSAYEYFASFAVSLSCREILTVPKLWLGSNPIYDDLSDDPEAARIRGLEFRLYTGAAGEGVDPLILEDFDGDATEAATVVPDGVAYMVFERLPLADFGNVVPPGSAIVSVAAVDLPRIATPIGGQMQRGYRNHLWSPENNRWIIYNDVENLIEVRSASNGDLLYSQETIFWEQFVASFSKVPLSNLQQRGGLVGTDGPWIWAEYKVGPVGRISSAIWLQVDRQTMQPVGAFYGPPGQGDGFNWQTNERRVPSSNHATNIIVQQAAVSVNYLAGGGQGGPNFFNNQGAVFLLKEGTEGSFPEYVWGKEPFGKDQPVSLRGWCIAVLEGLRENGFTEVYFAFTNASWVGGSAYTIYRARVFINAYYDQVLDQTLGVDDLEPVITLSRDTYERARFAYDPTDDSIYVHDQSGVVKIDVSNKIQAQVAWTRNDLSLGAAASNKGSFDAKMERINGVSFGAATGGTLHILDPETGTTIESYDQNLPDLAATGGSDTAKFWDAEAKRLGTVNNDDGAGWIYGPRQGGGPEALSAIVADIWARSGGEAARLDVSDLDGIVVQGYALTSDATGRSAIDPLAQLFDFDVAEIDGKIVCVRRGADPIETISLDDLVDTGGEDGLTLRVRGRAKDVPPTVSVTYASPDRDFQPSTQMARRDASVSLIEDAGIGLDASTVALTDQEAVDIAERLMWTALIERDRVQPFRLPPKYLHLAPTDAISIGGMIVRLTRVVIGDDFTLECEGKVARAYSSEAPPTGTVAEARGDGGGRTVPPAAAELTPIIIDAPLRDLDIGGPGASYYVALARGAGATEDYRASYVTLGAGVNAAIGPEQPLEAMLGTIVTAPPAPPNDYWFSVQRDGFLDIEVLSRSDLLATVTENEFRDGINTLAIITPSGAEVLSFKAVTDLGEGVFRLTTLMRGLRGTEVFSRSVAVGQKVALVRQETLGLVTVDASVSGQPATVTVGGNAQPSADITYGHNSLKPYAPVHVARSDDGSGITISWVRRTRIGGAWRDDTPTVPLSEATEAYEIDIYDGASVVRTLSSTSPSALYAAADVTADFGSTPESLTVAVYQIGAIGRGYGVPRTLKNGEKR
ncbi:MAG: phage tail protein [Pseudomonadota bacterium]